MQMVLMKTQSLQSPRLVEFSCRQYFRLSRPHARDMTLPVAAYKESFARSKLGDLTWKLGLMVLMEMTTKLYLPLFIELFENTAQYLVTETPHFFRNKSETGMKASIDSLKVFSDNGRRKKLLLCSRGFSVDNGFALNIRRKQQLKQNFPCANCVLNRNIFVLPYSLVQISLTSNKLSTVSSDFLRGCSFLHC